jgi:signal recognition particle subunit SRP54
MKRQSVDLEEFLSTTRRRRSMGSIGYWLSKLPGLSDIRKQLEVDMELPGFFKRVEGMICSMTPEERRNPAIIDGHRCERIAKGSGTTHWDVAQLVRAWQQR